MAVEVELTDSVLIDELAPVYAAAFAAPPYSEPDASGLLDRLPRHRDLPGFALAIARRGDGVIGFAYGFTGTRGDTWTEAVADAIGPERADALLGGHFALVELAVAPDEQRSGVGGRLLETVLADRPEPNALLQTHDADTPAMRLYERSGFRRLAAVPLGVAMVKELT